MVWVYSSSILCGAFAFFDCPARGGETRPMVSERQDGEGELLIADGRRLIDCRLPIHSAIVICNLQSAMKISGVDAAAAEARADKP
jgi:hypothetical protein